MPCLRQGPVHGDGLGQHSGNETLPPPGMLWLAPGPLSGLGLLWLCPGWSTEANFEPWWIGHSRKSLRNPPSSPSILCCLIRPCFSLSGTTHLALADFVTCFWRTWIWQPFGFHILYFGTSAWFRALPDPLASRSPITSSRDYSTPGLQHCRCPTTEYGQVGTGETLKSKVWKYFSELDENSLLKQNWNCLNTQ